MAEKKITLPSLSNQDWKKAKVKTEEINKSLLNILMDNIIELTKLIYA